MNKRVWVSVAWLAAVVLVAGPTMGQDQFKKGSDIFVTHDDGVTRIDLSQYPVIEELFGGPPKPQVVQLKGKPIAGLGQTDTVVDRASDVTLAVGQTATVAATLRGLSLVSTSPVSFGGDAWDLFVSVSPQVASTGTITITRTGQDGGSFNATFQVYPHLVFSRGSDVVRVDCGVDCEPITLTSTRSPWVSSDGSFSPAQAGVPHIANGTSYDGDGDGFADDQFVGGSNVFPAFQPSSPFNPVPLSHDHPPVAEHKQWANIQCKSSTSPSADGTASPSSPLCAVVAEPKDPVAVE